MTSHNINQTNQLQKVDDDTNLSKGFKDVTGNDYLYDDFGNMTSDINKNITHITYNHLNLPKKISFQNNNYIEYTYDASGVKVKKKVKKGNTLSTTEYLNGFQYRAERKENVQWTFLANEPGGGQEELLFFPHAEGYVDFTEINTNDGEYRYVYQYKDHFGNIRLNYAWDEDKDKLTILNEHHYYAFGLEHTYYNTTKKEFRKQEGGGNNHVIIMPVANEEYNFKFGSKEYQTSLDLNLYDFGARNYDPSLGRWMNIDAFAGAFKSVSPYNYALNNPVVNIDPSGHFTYDWRGLPDWSHLDDGSRGATSFGFAGGGGFGGGLGGGGGGGGGGSGGTDTRYPKSPLTEVKR